MALQLQFLQQNYEDNCQQNIIMSTGVPVIGHVNIVMFAAVS
jgi:hypothetical protein